MYLTTPLCIFVFVACRYQARLSSDPIRKRAHKSELSKHYDNLHKNETITRLFIYRLPTTIWNVEKNNNSKDIHLYVENTYE